MKIIGGTHKNRNFYMPSDIRPTSNMTRKAIFDIIGHDLTGWEVLELFAGSGAVGLEALSRGAQKVTFVEADPKCYETIQENVQLLFPGTHLGDTSLYVSPDMGTHKVMCPQNTELINSDAFVTVKNLGRRGCKFDLVFLDPPYGVGLVKKILKTLTSYDIFKPNSFLIVEHGKHENLPETEGRFSLLTHRKYGVSFLGIYQAGPAVAPDLSSDFEETQDSSTD